MTFEAAPQAEPAACLPPATPNGLHREWLTTEVAVIRRLYPTEGSAAVQQQLPHRSLASIRAKAAAMGLRCHRPPTLGRRFTRLYAPSEAVDMAIREGYSRATKKGDIKALAERVGRPAWWVQKRASEFGLTRTNRSRLDCWTERELELLEQWRMARLQVIRKKLAAEGFARTETAIAIQLKRRKIDRNDPDVWTGGELGRLLGVNPATVADWVERRGLPGKLVGNALRIRRAPLRQWIKKNQQWVDLRKVDQPWFWELMFGESAE